MTAVTFGTDRLPYSVTSDGCWEWQGAMATHGYGRFGDEYAHRISYVRAKGPIPDGLEIDHLCRNKRCINPDHLEAVTHAENSRRATVGPACKRGHAFTPENTYVRSDGHKRVCRRCAELRSTPGWIKTPIAKPRRRPPLQTECRNGHSFSDAANLYIDSRGRRQCRPCTIARTRRNYWAKAA